jgi:hypothetical protein
MLVEGGDHRLGGETVVHSVLLPVEMLLPV